jgi:DNA-binding winged helix-turn-helix (wHTH) protein/Tfp pilus assembly protein PilF
MKSVCWDCLIVSVLAFESNRGYNSAAIMGTASVNRDYSVRLARFSVFELNLCSGELRKDGKPTPLPPQPTKVLALLVSRPGELVTREEIRREVWEDGTVVDFEQGLNHCIRQIRNELNDHADHPFFIKTVTRRGYRFIAPVATEPVGNEALARPSTLASDHALRISRSALVGLIAFSAITLVLLVAETTHNLFSRPTSAASIKQPPITRPSDERPGESEIGDPNAQLAYLKGRFYWNKRTPESLRKAADYFQLAADKAPKAAVAYAGLADAYDLMGYLGETPPQIAYPKATAAALRALQLDNSLAEAHVSLADIRAVYDWQFADAEREYRRAIELKPNYATAHQWYAAFLSAMGRTDDALREGRRALELDPLSLIINVTMGRTYYFAGQYDNAIERLSTTVDMDPTFVLAHVNLALAYEQKQLLTEAIAELDHAAKMSGQSPHVLATLGNAYGLAGDRSRAERIANQLQRSNTAYVSSFDIALIYAGIGDRKRSFEYLERAYQKREGDLIFLKVEPRLSRLRQDARFIELSERVGLPP